MADKAGLWAHMTKKHGLKTFAFDQLVAWPLPTTCSARSGTSCRHHQEPLHGFRDVVDSEAMFERLLRRFRREKIVP